jgi:hypothetical protein
MKTPHKHAEIIKAWADGAEIECKFDEFDSWAVVYPPHWNPDYEYRIKPEPKPDVFQDFYFWVGNGIIVSCFAKNTSNPANVRITFDGETGELKAAEVLK